jgi:S-adenosylmethionine:tRNA ribosyltransferase-isomerase
MSETLQGIEHINLKEFQYDLPENRIALFPTQERDQSKLLVYNKDGTITEDVFLNLDSHIPPGTHLFFNNSKVIPARLIFTKSTGATVEIFCLKPAEPSDYALSLSSHNGCSWVCMIGNTKKFKSPGLELKIQNENIQLILTAEKVTMQGNVAEIRFTWNSDRFSFAEILYLAGAIPLPPYIKRQPRAPDKERYQTIYSSREGSVAAPTAGLHFTSRVFSRLKEKNIMCHEVTLHVGAGTFQPVKSDSITQHEMHPEFFEISLSVVQQILQINNPVGCVGTTSVRTLESIYWIGVKLRNNMNSESIPSLDQWEPYTLAQDVTIEESFTSLNEWFLKNNSEKTVVSTRMIIVPGYRFRMTNLIVTNFHQPGSTLLLLVGAFIGKSWKDIYKYALDHDFRFLSYGDSSLLFRRL